MNERPDAGRPEGELPELTAEQKRRKKKVEKAKADEAAAEEQAAQEEVETDTEENAEQSAETSEPAPLIEAVPDEAAVRAVSAEAMFQRRVALSELREKLPEDVYEEVRAVLEQSSAAWHLERGRYLLQRLVAEVEPPAGPVQSVKVKFATRRESTPVAPDEVTRKVAEVLAKPVPIAKTLEQVTEVIRELPDEDEVELVVETLDVGVVRVEVDSESIQAAQVDTPDAPVIAEVIRPVERVAVEEAEAAISARTEVEQVFAEPITPEPTDPLDRAIRKIEDEWVRVALPRIAGGSPELDDQPELIALDEPAESSILPPEDVLTEEVPGEREERPRPPRRPVELITPEPGGPISTPAETPPQRRQPHRHRHWLKPFVIRPEYSPEAPVLPDTSTKLRAKKLLRRLAHRYGLRMSPSIEAYLLQLVFRPRLIDGRLIRGITVNLDIISRTIEALAKAYPAPSRGAQ